jgi:uncharacterized membrane protein YeaQ/YmgE (transglycosylase-associated protein family)
LLIFAASNQLNSRIMGIIYSLLIGCLAGFCAGKLMKGGGFGIIMNIVLGLFGGALGGWLFSLLGIQWGGVLGQLGTAIIGAVAILWVASLIKK